VLVPDAHLPADIGPGDLLAVPATGAYHVMASNYNHFARPPVIAVRDGRAWPLIRRETGEDILRRDVG
jgi:diaminopimelate decarboxylase